MSVQASGTATSMVLLGLAVSLAVTGCLGARPTLLPGGAGGGGGTSGGPDGGDAHGSGGAGARDGGGQGGATGTGGGGAGSGGSANGSGGSANGTGGSANGSGGSANGTGGTVTGTGGGGVVPAKLAFTLQPPKTVLTGTPMTIQVTVQDAAGIAVKSATDTITIAFGNNPGGSNLLGLLSAAAVAGVASFDTIGLDQVSTGYTLVASSTTPGLGTATSAAFDVRQPTFVRVTTGLYGGLVSGVAVAGGPQPAVYAGTPAGVFKSTNKGGTWVSANFGNAGEADLVIVDPKNPSTLYITPSAGGASYGYAGFFFGGKSTDGGASWRAIGQDVGAGQIGSFAIDPVNTAIVYAGGPFGIYRSTTSGNAWTKTPFAFACYALTIDPITPTILYAYAYDQMNFAAKGIYKSVDSGTTWNPVNNPALVAADLNIGGLFATPTGVFAVASKLYRSTDGGATWVALTAQAWMIAYAPSQVLRVYAARGNSVAVSNDGGATFGTPVTVGPSTFRSSSPNGLAVDPTNANQVYAGTEGGVYVSADGGVTWNPSSIGIATQTVSAVAMNPAMPNVILAGTPDSIYRTTDAGTTWSRALASGVQALALDPANSQIVYGCSLGAQVYRSADGGATWGAGVATGGISYCYNIAVRGANLWVPTVSGGVRHSADSGANWTSTTVTAPTYAVAIDPTGNNLYAGSNNGTSRSVNAGVVWTPMVVADLATALLVDPVTPTTVYAGLSCGSGQTGTSSGGGFKRSIDSGANWGAVVAGPCVNALLGLASGTLIAVGRGSPAFASSADHGVTWTRGGSGITGEALSVAATSDAKTIYVGSALGLYKSTSGGL